MNNQSDRQSITELATNCIGLQIAQIIGKTLLDVIYWETLPQTPYYLKKKIQYLEHELITKTCRVNETIIIP